MVEIKELFGWLVSNLLWLVAVLIGGGLGSGFLTTFTQVPWYSRVLILLGLALLILWGAVHRHRVVVWISERLHPSPLSEATTLVPATPAAVEIRAQKLRDLGEQLASFLADRIANEPAVELVGKSQEEHLQHIRTSRLYEQKTARMYRSQFQAPLVAVQEDLSALGCSDSEFQHDLASSQRAIHPVLLQRIASRAQVLAIKATNYAATLREKP